MMKTVLVANAKGGSGKTTLATNVAGWFASRHRNVALQDEDPQCSASLWLARRPPLFPRIHALKRGTTHKEAAGDFDWRIVDTPAGLHGDVLRDWIRESDFVLVPMVPSAFDMQASETFLGVLLDRKPVRDKRVAVGLVGMRVDSRTQSAAELNDFLYGFDLPLLSSLRETQVYVRCARDGLTVFDLPPSRGAQDWEQWRGIVSWLL